ncbi:MAG: GNAT family N-acetyltransferase [Deltaproteobacteria bacterium]|nr:GNAT family N-acetyltransferase [Deltaproteobacteria bacterium]
MIHLQRVESSRDFKEFNRVFSSIYENIPAARNTEDSIVGMLTKKKSAFFNHAKIFNFLIRDGSYTAGRLSLIHDRNLPQYVQVAFFEAHWGLPNLTEPVIHKAKLLFPECKKIVFGLCGHLNYAAGFLEDNFDKPPLFGLPYSPPWYPDYFKDLKKQKMVSFRFDNSAFYNLLDAGKMTDSIKDFRIRHLEKKHLRRDVKLYTYLNNINFRDHIYWSDRTWEEDYELFHPFRFFIKEQNLIFAEYKGEVIGFLLWYPDFNELATGIEDLGPKHLMKFKFGPKIKTARFTEIAVKKEFRRTGVVELMVTDLAKSLRRDGFKFTEGGFIFEENSASIGMTLRLLENAFGKKLEPYRRYAVFEEGL